MISYRAKKAIARRHPSSPVALGSSYEEDILSALETEFQEPVKQTGLTRKEFLEVIWKAAAYYRKGYARTRDKAKGLRDQIVKEMKISDAKKKTAVLSVLLFLEAITRDKYPVLTAYLETGNVSASDRAQAIKTATAQAASSAADHLRQVAKETISEAGTLVKDTAGSLNDALPWYLKPKVLLPVGLVAVALFYGGPLLRMLPKRRSYEKNPVKSARDDARETFETFHDREPDLEYTIPAVNTSALALLGTARCIGYESDKWSGKKTDYLHDFEDEDIKVYSTADRKALVIVGGDLNVTRRGITG